MLLLLLAVVLSILLGVGLGLWLRPRLLPPEAPVLAPVLAAPEPPQALPAPPDNGQDAELARLCLEARASASGLVLALSMIERALEREPAQVEDALETIAQAQAAAARQLDRVERMVATLRRESGGQALDLENPAAIYVHDLINGAIEDARLLARPGGVEVELLTGIPPEARFERDPARVRQVLGILLPHAVRRSPPGSRVELCASRVGDHVHLVLQDGGPAEAPGEEEMDLQVCRSLLSMLGGTMAVQGEPGEGTCFRLELPLREPVVEEPEALFGPPVAMVMRPEPEA